MEGIRGVVVEQLATVVSTPGEHFWGAGSFTSAKYVHSGRAEPNVSHLVAFEEVDLHEIWEELEVLWQFRSQG